MAYTGNEKRRHLRSGGRFIVSYRIAEEHDNVDISQTKNLSLGGALITTNRQFNPGIKLILEIRLPFDPYPIVLVGRVVESKEVVSNLIYETRLEFLTVDERHKKAIGETVDYYFKRDKK